MANTNHLGITLVEQSQSQKEVTVNQALTRLDAVLNTGAKSRTINTPPGSPASGDLYIVGSSPTGAWSGQAGNIAYYDQVWKFITPKEGITLWVNDESMQYVFNGTSWASIITNDLGALESLSTTGYAVRTAANTWVTRSITSGVGISVSNGDGVGGDTIVTFTAGFQNMSDSGIFSPATGETLVYSGGLWRNTKGHTTLFYNSQTATSYTLVSTDSGRTIYIGNASAITLTLPNNFAVGFNCNVIQSAAGQVTFTPASGANRRNRQSHTKTAGQWAVCKLQVVSNSGGTSAEYVLSGDTAA